MSIWGRRVDHFFNERVAGRGSRTALLGWAAVFAAVLLVVILDRLTDVHL